MFFWNKYQQLNVCVGYVTRCRIVAPDQLAPATSFLAIRGALVWTLSLAGGTWTLPRHVIELAGSALSTRPRIGYPLSRGPTLMPQQRIGHCPALQARRSPTLVGNLDCKKPPNITFVLKSVGPLAARAGNPEHKVTLGKMAEPWKPQVLSVHDRAHKVVSCEVAIRASHSSCQIRFEIVCGPRQARCTFGVTRQW